MLVSVIDECKCVHTICFNIECAKKCIVSRQLCWVCIAISQSEQMWGKTISSEALTRMVKTHIRLGFISQATFLSENQA